MANDCDRFEEKLSAYLDGALGHAEMAEVAAHLEKCPACSALLDKMRRLEELASGAVTDFDDALMEKLESRIAADIERLPESAEEARPVKARIIPMWYRYAAIAASFIIVFLAGRMAFRDSMTGFPGDRSRPGGVIYTPTVTAPESGSMNKGIPADTMTAPQRETSIPSTIVVPSMAADVESDAMEAAPRVSDQALQEMQAEKSEAARRGRGLDTAAQPVSEKKATEPRAHIADRVESIRAAPGRLKGKIVDRQTGVPLPGVSVQLEGTRLGARSDQDGQFEIYPVPPDTYNLVFSGVGYEAAVLPDVAVSPEVTVEENIELAQSVYQAAEITTAASFEPEEEVGLAETLPELTQTPLTMDSLKTLYASYFKPLSPLQYDAVAKPTGAAKSQPSGVLIGIETAINDSLDSISPEDESFRRLETLYLRARANYDIYRKTGGSAYLERTRSDRAEMMRLIQGYIEQGIEVEILQGYLDELERWQIVE